MKKTMKKLLCVAIVLIMTLSLMAIPVNADTTGAEPVKLTPAEKYAAAKDGDLLQTINFKADYWSHEFASSSNCGANVEVSEDGSMAKLTVLNTSSKRAMWGSMSDESRFPLREVTETIENPDDPENPTLVYGKSNNYTIVYDVDFGNTGESKTIVGLQIDGDHALCVDGYGYSYLYAWNTKKVDLSTVGDDKWNYHISQSKSDKQTFAVEIDTENNVMTLYIKDIDDSFGKVREMTYDGATIGKNLNATVTIRGQVASDSWAEVSNIGIYKGLVAETLTVTEPEPEPEPDNGKGEIYAAAKDGDVLQEINFKGEYWNNEFASDSNKGAKVEVSEDGRSVKLTVLEESYKRAMWGGISSAESFPLNENTKYTIYFDAKFGNALSGNVAVGIQVDGDNTLLVDGYGYNYWFAWNSSKVGKSDENDGYDKWNFHIDGKKTDKQSFAVEIDPENNEMTLYVAESDGTYNKVRTLTYADAEFGEDLVCRIYVRTINPATEVDDSFWVELSDLKVCKGLVPVAVEDDNTDDDNTGDDNTGDENTGNENTGDENTGDENTDGTTGDNNDNGTTDTPATSDTEAETEATKSGCLGSVAMSGVALVGACAAMLAIKRKKEEN